MNMITIIVGGTLTIFLAIFIMRLFYTIYINMVNGQTFNHALEQELNRLRLSNMLTALGINKTDYLYQNSIKDIHQQMKNCSVCTNTDECDEKLTTPDVEVTEIDFCNNEADLKEIKQRQS